MRTFHIGFEGTSGAGKSTQAKILVEKLQARGVKTKYVKNPNGTSFGKSVMNGILSKDPCKLAEILAFASCFCQSVNELIMPALSGGICVVSDRGIGSAYAHALYRCQRAISEDCFAKIMLEIGSGNAVFPDLTFLLSLSIENGIARKERCADKSKLDALNSESMREALAYEVISCKLPNWVVINATEGIDEISELIWMHVEKILKERVDEK